ncbi:MAG: PAS domain S-box protein, partial [Chloroflexota bacterium]
MNRGVMASIILLVISLFSTTFILYFTLKNIQKTGYTSLVIFSFTLAAAALSNYFVERSSLSFGFLFYSLVFLFVRLAFASLLIYTLQITLLDRWANLITILILLAEPVITQFMLWDAIGIDYFDPSVYPPPVSASLLAVSPPPYLVNNIFINLVLLFCLFNLSRNLSFRSSSLRIQSGLNLFGLSAALIIINIPVNSNILNAHQVGLLAAMIAGISTIPGLFLGNNPGISQIAREKVVEYMDDGWLVLDQENIITDLNRAAEKILGLPRNKLISQPAEKIFVDWPNLMNSLNDVRPLDLKGSVRIQDNWTYLNIHISPLLNPEGQQVGKLIAWRDITEMRVADEARQHARDEMFILLHSITSAASRALNLDDFLAEAIYQILFSSHSQAISVYLVEEHTKTNEPRNLVLVAQHGKPFMPESQKNSIPESFEIVKWVMDHRAPLLIPD